jgi:hypothetical protein
MLRLFKSNHTLSKNYRAMSAAGLLSALVLLPQTATAETADTNGTDFWLTFPQNFDGGKAQFSFFLSAAEDRTISIEIPGLSFSDSVDVAANVATKYSLPQSVEVMLTDTVVSKGIHVSSLEEFTVYGLSRLEYTTDAYLGLPSDVAGSDYTLMAWDTGYQTNSSQYTLVGISDQTTVTLLPSLSDPCGTEMEITLNAGDVYQHLSCNQGDVTGTRIQASQPISVFAGHQCANVPDTRYGYCDHIIEQIPSTDTWGKRFLVTPLATRTKGDTFRVLANYDETIVKIPGVEDVTLSAGEYYETLISDAGVIEANQPIMVSQYSNGTTFDGVTSDPFMMVIPPYEQFLDNYTFATPTEGFRVNYVNVVVKSDFQGALRLDGNEIESSLFTPIPDSDFSYAQIELAPGSHTLSGAVAGVFVYGYDKDDSYGYPGGLSLSEVALVDSVDLLPNFELADGEACFKAKVSDALNAALADIRVDFVVELIEGSDRTDDTGIATFCVEAGENPEEYNVTATVGDVTNEVTVVKPVEPRSTGDDDSGSDGDSGSGGSGSVITLMMLGFMALVRKRHQLKKVIG